MTLPTSPVQLVVLSGVSGSGKSTALHALEDAGYFCVDNLPAPLLEPFLVLADEHKGIDRVAVVMDAREASYYPNAAQRLVEARGTHPSMRLLFFDASDERVIARFKVTRRTHPCITSGDAETIDEALRLERAWLEPIRKQASRVLDTSGMTVHELKRNIRDLYAPSTVGGLRVHLMSFGFRHALPNAADYVFDVRFLPNPYFVESLRDHSGLQAEVANFVLSDGASTMMLDRIEGLLVDVLPLSEREGKPSVTIAIGCTGGRHRSVAIVEALHARLKGQGRDVLISHRDIER